MPEKCPFVDNCPYPGQMREGEHLGRPTCSIHPFLQGVRLADVCCWWMRRCMCQRSAPSWTNAPIQDRWAPGEDEAPFAVAAASTTVAGADQTDPAAASTAGLPWVGVVMALMVVSEGAEAGVVMASDEAVPGDEMGAEVMAWEANRETPHPQLRLRTAAAFCRNQLFDVSLSSASCCKLSACSVACL